MIWRCEKGHEWEAAVKSRTINRTGCPYCSHNKVLAGFNDLATLLPDIAAEWSAEIILYFRLRLRSLPIVRLGGSVRIAAESGTLLFLLVPVAVNARIAVGTYSRKGLTICRQHTRNCFGVVGEELAIEA